jgi:hypothetical protein
MEIKTDQVGLINAETEAASYVKVIDDAVNIGGCLILTSKTVGMRNCFDAWIECADQLKSYFLEAGWRIAWL